MSMNVKSIGMILAFAGLIFFANGCGESGGDQHKSGGAEIIDKSGPEYTSAYICPMYCPGSGSDMAGNCPVCNMKYVINPDVPKKSPQDAPLPTEGDTTHQHVDGETHG